MDWVSRHKVIRRLSILWAWGLITFATVSVFTDLSLITAAVVSLYTVAVGLLGTSIAFYFKNRAEEDDKDKDR